MWSLSVFVPQVSLKAIPRPLVRTEDVDVFCDKIRTGKDAQAGFGYQAIKSHISLSWSLLLFAGDQAFHDLRSSGGFASSFSHVKRFIMRLLLQQALIAGLGEEEATADGVTHTSLAEETSRQCGMHMCSSCAVSPTSTDLRDQGRC